MEILTDSSYEIPTENNKDCIETARGLVSKLGSPSDDDVVFCEWLITVLDEIVKNSRSDDGVINREHLWTKLYQLQSSVEWKFYLKSLTKTIAIKDLCRTYLEGVLYHEISEPKCFVQALAEKINAGLRKFPISIATIIVFQMIK